MKLNKNMKTFKKFICLPLLFAGICIIESCQKDNDAHPITIPHFHASSDTAPSAEAFNKAFINKPIVEIKATTAIIYSSIDLKDDSYWIDHLGIAFREKGGEWNLCTPQKDASPGSFRVELSNLSPATSYEVKAVALIYYFSEGQLYNQWEESEPAPFTTPGAS